MRSIIPKNKGPYVYRHTLWREEYEWDPLMFDLAFSGLSVREVKNYYENLYIILPPSLAFSPPDLGDLTLEPLYRKVGVYLHKAIVSMRIGISRPWKETALTLSEEIRSLIEERRETSMILYKQGSAKISRKGIVETHIEESIGITRPVTFFLTKEIPYQIITVYAYIGIVPLEAAPEDKGGFPVWQTMKAAGEIRKNMHREDSL